jgi:transposase
MEEPMRIACFKNNGVDYLQVQESYTKAKGVQGLRVIRNVGPLSRFDDGKPEYLKRLRASFKQGNPLIESLSDLSFKQKATEKLSVEFDRKKDADCFTDPKNIGYFILEALFGDLGIYDVVSKYKSIAQIRYDLVNIVKMLVFGRVLDPDSKLATWEKKDAYLFGVAKSADLVEVYDSLDAIDAVSPIIQKRMDTKIKQAIGRDKTLCYYDVTNFFFEIDKNDADKTDAFGNTTEGLRKSGPSKAKNRKPIVQMGLFCDPQGIPISYKIFPGNHIDQTTLRPIMKESIDAMGYGHVVVVADGGLNSDKNICHTLDAQAGYLFSKSTKKSDKKTRAWILDSDGYVSNEKGSFKVKSQIRTRKVKDEKGKTREITEKVVSYWSRSHYLRELSENASFCKYLEEVTKHPDKLKDKPKKVEKYLTKTQVDKATGVVLEDAVVALGLNWDKIDEDRALMGYYTLLTSELDMPDREIIDRYSGLSRIEDAFRATKSDLSGRPVFVRTPAHINGHFCICFIALVLIRIIQLKIIKHRGRDPKATKKWITGLSAERIQAALAGFCADALPGGYLRTTRIDGDLRLVLDSLGIQDEFRIPAIEEVRRFRYTLKKAGLIHS